MLRKLRIKFVLITMVMVTALLCTVFTAVYHSTKTDLENKSHALLQRIVENPFQSGRPDPFDREAQIPYFTLELGKQGELLNASSMHYDLSDEAFILQILQEVSKTDSKTGVLPEFDLRYRKAAAPGKQFFVFADTSNEKAMLSSLLTSSLLIGLLCWLTLLGVSIILARWAVRPVEDAWQQQRQFVSDASHELKTPLTVIMTNAEMLQDTGNSKDDQVFLSGNILTMSKQMQTLLEQMLELARSDNMRGQAEFSRVDLSLLAEDAVLSFEPVFFDRGMTLNCQIQPEVAVEGNQEQLQQLLGIFLDNAQKYATAGGETTVTLTKPTRSKCRLAVSNEGPPIPAEELGNLFKRFYRADKARTRNGSFGLGLSIARSIAQQHNAKIWAESTGGINSFFVEMNVFS